MTARKPRWEIVQTDAGFHARFRSSNGRVIVSSEVYTRKRAAIDAIHYIARSMSPTARIWISSMQLGGRPAGSEVRYGHPDDTYTTAHVIEVRDIDEREVTP